MPDHPYPLSASEVVATLPEIFRPQGERVAVEVLETANGTITEPEYDNLDGGTYYYTLRLEIPRRACRPAPAHGNEHRARRG